MREELWRERLRHEQTDSEYCLVEVACRDEEPFGAAADWVVDRLVRRLRCCDVVGHAAEDRLVALLVDTDAAGGEKVASDLHELLAANPRPMLVRVFPSTKAESSIAYQSADDRVASTTPTAAVAQ